MISGTLRHSDTRIARLRDRILGCSCSLQGVAPFLERDLRSARFRALRNTESAHSDRLDVDRTVEPTISAGGLFSADYETWRASAEYDVLIDRLRTSDHLATLFRQYIEGLTAVDTKCNIYHFHRDPRYCLDSDGRTRVLADLGRRSFDSRLIIMSDCAGLCDPVTGDPGPWAQDATAWRT